MNNIFTLYKKELNYYLNNPVGYIVVVLFAIFANFIFFKDIFISGSASLKPFFGLLPWLIMIFTPAISMRALSEEKKSNTIETLLTLPVSESQVIVAKFLSILTVQIVGLLLTLSVPVWLAFLTELYFPEIIVGYVGVILFSAAMVALCLFYSSQTKNQVVAFLSGVLTIFILLVISTDFIAPVLPKFVQDTLTVLAPLNHMDSFSKGLLDLKSILYFLSFCVAFIFLTVVDLEKRA